MVNEILCDIYNFGIFFIYFPSTNENYEKLQAEINVYYMQGYEIIIIALKISNFKLNLEILDYFFFAAMESIVFIINLFYDIYMAYITLLL